MPPLPPWPEGLPESVTTPQGELLPPALADAVADRLALCDAYPEFAQTIVTESMRYAAADAKASAAVDLAQARAEVRERWPWYGVVAVAVLTGVLGVIAGRI